MSTEEVKEAADGIGSTEHDQAMIEKADSQTIESAVQEKVDQQETTPASKEEARPEWLPEKYKTVEDFLEGHKSLEKKLGEREEVEPTEESEDASGDEEETTQAKAGPLDSFYTEYAETGELSDESYKALEDAGYPNDVVDTYIKGFESQVKEVSAKANEMVGGKENYDAMVEWAVDNMTPEQLDSYNSQLAMGGDNWEIALLGLQSKYLNSGDAPVERYRSGDKPTPTGVQPFTSQEELTAAVTDKKYKTSPEYRAQVEKRLAISDNAAMGANIPEGYAAHG